jgi:hypothetical protein
MLGQVPVSRAPGNLGNGTYMSGFRVYQDLAKRSVSPVGYSRLALIKYVLSRMQIRIPRRF